MDVPRAHTPTWTPPSDWAAGPARELEEQEIDVLPTMPLASRLRKPGHRRAQTQTLEKVLQTPPTTNVMLAADKTHLRKTSRKLERMLGEMPVIMLEDGDDDEVILNVGDNGASGVRRRTTVTGHGDASRAVGRKHLPWQNQTSPFPQLRIDSAALISTASPHSAQPTPSDDVHSNRLSVTSSDGNVSSNGITPPASPGFLPEQDDKRRAQNQMQKLQRFLGESVPAELLLQPVQSNLSTQSSAASPTSPASTDNGLKAKARRRLSLELSTLAAFSLTSRLTGGGKDSGRTTPSGGRDSPAPRAASPRQDSPSPSFAFAHSSGRRHLPASLSISSSSIYSELDPPMESPTEHAHIVEAENVIFMSPTASDVLSPMSIDIRSPLTPGTINLASPLPLERSPGLKRSPSSIERKLAAVTPAPSYESSSLRLPKRGQSQDLLSTHLQSHEHALPLPHTLHKAMVEHEARTKRRDKELKDREKAERKERERLEKEFEKEMKTREKELKLEQKRTRDRSRTIGSSGSGSRSQTASMFEPMPTTSRPATASSTKSAAPPLISKKPSKAQLVSVSSAISADKQPTASAPSTVSKASATSSTNSRAELATLATKLSLDVPSSKLSLDMGRSSTASSSDSGHGHNSRLPTSPTSPPSGEVIGLRGLLRKKSFDAWGGRGGGMSGLPPLPLLKSQISSPLPAIPPSPVGRRRDESPAAGRNASPLRNENSPGTRRNDSPSRTPSLQRQESVSATSSSTRRRDASPSVSRQDSAPARIEHGSSTLSLNRTESRGSPRLRTAELISSPNGSSTRLLRSPDSPSIKASRSLLQDVPVPPLPTNHASSPLRKATNLPTPPVPPLPQSVEVQREW
ncbi:hypothetical protein BKA62DRAFT_673037 [Auriculariales sp. MPI-PUGE-AT-0066]|nr:hypothetical protein BKA62DRAFT_673037 [Auriculariales sp. MPI-PUGE-AT-0066]